MKYTFCVCRVTVNFIRMFSKYAPQIGLNARHVSVFMESIKMRVLRAKVPTCLACLRAHVPTCLACLRDHVPTCLTCLRADVSTCLACLRADVPTCLAWLSARVATCLACLAFLSAHML